MIRSHKVRFLSKLALLTGTVVLALALSSLAHAQRRFNTADAAVEALVAAARSGDTIEVAGGTYEEGTIDLRSKALTLHGGFAAEANDRDRFAARNRSASRTVVVGPRDLGTDTGQHGAVFLLGQSDGARIDGFTITGGRHGIFAEYSTSREPLVIVNNIIEDNGVETPAYDEYGGGIHSEYPSLVIANNVIRGNRSVRGGGISPPGLGSFADGRGEFLSEESFNGRPILVRFVISEVTATSCRFEQAFSDDDGASWEVNWIAVDTRSG